MYNWYPIFKVLADDKDFRTKLNSKCYNTIRLLEQGYYWYPLNPNSSKDELGIALNGHDDAKYGFPVPKVQSWFEKRDKWQFILEDTYIL